MKKKSILILLFLSIILISLVLANTLVLGDEGLNASNNPESPILGFDLGSDDVTGLPGDPEKITGIVENLSDEEIRKQYLKQEWTKILNNSKVGKYLLKADGVATKADPVFNILLGIGFSFSWLFVLTIILYIELLDAGYKLINAFQVYYPIIEEHKNKFKWGFFAGFFILFSTIRVAKYVAQFIINIISGNYHWIVQLILVVFVVAFLIVFAMLFDTIKEVFNKVKRDIEIGDIKRKQKKAEKRESRRNKMKSDEYAKELLEEEEKMIEEDTTGFFEGVGSDD